MDAVMVVTPFVIAACALLLATGVHLLAIAATARAFGVEVEEVTIGFGPVVARGDPESRTRLLLRLIPLGGFVKFFGELDDCLPGSFGHLGRARQVVVMMSGVFAQALVAIVFLGGKPGLAALLAGFAQFFQGALAPTTTGVDLLQRFATFAQAEPWLAVVGLVAAKLAALNALPLPVLNGGDALLALLRPRRVTRSVLEFAGALVAVWLCIAWIVALVAAVV